MYYQVKVEFTQDGPKGEPKKVKEVHLVDAVSPTEAEAKATKHFTDLGFNDFEVTDANQSKILSVIS